MKCALCSHDATMLKRSWFQRVCTEDNGEMGKEHFALLTMELEPLQTYHVRVREYATRLTTVPLLLLPLYRGLFQAEDYTQYKLW